MKYYIQAKLDSARLFAEEEDVPEQRKALLARLQVCGKLWTQIAIPTSIYSRRVSMTLLFISSHGYDGLSAAC